MHKMCERPLAKQGETPSEGEQAKGASDTDVARGQTEQGCEFARYPLSCESSCWCFHA
jgi:hypothetical protein